MDFHALRNKIQAQAKNAVLRALKDDGQALLQMATGTGKTHTARKVIEAVLAENPLARILWICSSNELIEQTVNSILEAMPGLNVSVFDGETKDGNGQVVVASIQTLSRKNNLKRFHPNEFSLVNVDECHHEPAESWHETLGYFKNAKKFGFTATPYRPDGRSLDDTFGKPVFELSFRGAQEIGLLAQDESYAILTNSVLKPIITKDGEYSPRELERLHTTKDRNKTIVQSYIKYGRGEMAKTGLRFKSVCFCINTNHAKRMAKHFSKAGITSKFIVGDSKHMVPKERKETYEAFRSTFNIEVLCVVNIFNESVDIPDLGCVMMARPTRSNIVYSQQLGRGSRPVPGYKSKFVVLDYVDNTRRGYHGYTMSNLKGKGVSHTRVITEYLHEPDPVVVEERVKNVMRGVEEFENRARAARGTWSVEAIEKVAKSMRSVADWRRKSSGSLDAARKLGVYNEIVEKYNLRTVRRWTDSDIAKDALKYSSKTEWSTASPGAVDSAINRGIYDEVTKHMQNRRGTTWTKRLCKIEARKHESKSRWKLASGGSYAAALRNGWVKECTSHMIPLRKALKHSEASIRKAALTCNTRAEFRKRFPGMRSAARRQGIYDEVTKHMQYGKTWTKGRKK